jgi:probable HAF family extracellular repeat protein
LFSDGYGINSFGTAVGYSYTDGGSFLGIHAFMYEDSGLVDLTPTTDSATAEDINDAGQVTGWRNGHAFRWANGVFLDLGVPAGLMQSFGFAINSKGQVAGHAVSASGNEERIFRYTDGVGLEDLGGVGEHNQVFGMNGLGQIVGRGRPTSGSQQAFLYTDETGLISLNALIDPSLGWFILGAGGINDAGQIAGWAWNNFTLQTHAVRLNPAGTLTRPAAPTNLSATAVGSSRVDLGWTDSSGTETGFRIERRTGGETFSLVETVGANTVAYSDSGLAPTTTYEYRVLAFNVAGVSAYSNTASATTAAVDLVAPVVAIASPADGATVSGTVTISATASDDVGLGLLQLSVDGVVLCTTTQAALACSWNTRKVQTGAHRILARATDTSGNQATIEVQVIVSRRK